MKRSVAFYELISLLALFCCFLLLAACSKNMATSSYTTMKDAVNAVLENKDEELTYANGMYLYENQDAYNNNHASYILAFFKTDTSTSGYETVIYSVNEDILLSPWVYFTVPLRPEIIQMPNISNQMASLNEQYDLTHEIIKMASEKGRPIDMDAFAGGHQLAGHFEGCWFYVSIIGNDRNIQAAYNTETEELILADSITKGLRTTCINMDWVPCSAAENICSENFKKIKELFPDANLTIEGMVDLANKIAYEGYSPDAMSPGKEPMQDFFVEDRHGNTYTLKVFEDGSWIYLGS